MLLFKKWDSKYTILFLVWIAWIVNQLNWNIIPPLLPAIVKEYDLSNVNAGLLMTILILPYVIMQFVMGYLSARFSRTKLIVIGIIGYSTSTLITGFIPNFVGILILMAITGIFDGFHYVPSQVLIIKNFSKENRGLATGIWFTAPTVSLVISSILAPFLAISVGWRWTFFAIAIPGFFLAIICYRYLGLIENGKNKKNENFSSNQKPTKKRVWTTPLIVLSLLKASDNALARGMNTFLPLYLTTKYNLDIMWASIAFGIPSVITLIGSPIGGSLTRKFDTWKLLVMSTISSSILYFILIGVIGLMPYNLHGFLIVMYAMSITRTPTLPASVAFLNSIVDPEILDRAVSIWNGIGLMGVAITPVLMGYTADIIGFDGSFYLFAFFAVFVIILISIFPKKIIKNP